MDYCGSAPVRYSTRGLSKRAVRDCWLGLHPMSLWRQTPGAAAIRSNVPSAVLRRDHVHAGVMQACKRVSPRLQHARAWRHACMRWGETAGHAGAWRCWRRYVCAMCRPCGSGLCKRALWSRTPRITAGPSLWHVHVFCCVWCRTIRWSAPAPAQQVTSK